MDYPQTRRAALRLLCRMSYHSAVLSRKLAQKGFSKKSIDRVLDDCKRMGFLDDEQAILRELRRGYGPRYIQFKLQIPSDAVRDVITKDLQKERIGEMASKFPDKEKAIRTLQRKGFDFDIIIEIFSLREVE